MVKASHLGDKKYYYVCFSEHLARGSAVFFQDPVRNSAWRSQSERGLPVSASSPPLVPAGRDQRLIEAQPPRAP